MSLDQDADYTAIFRTNLGEFRVELFADETPVTVNHFVFLAREGFYDGLIFHRVIEGFMIQGGDPTGTGSGGPGYQFEDEIVPGLGFDQPGRLAMANAGPNTNGSQFFITTVPTEWLDGSHTIFGQVIEGQEVVDAISRVETGAGDRPQQEVFFERITIISDESTRQPDPSDTGSSSLSEYAELHAGGPGAIYIGDATMLVGLAVAGEFSHYGRDLGDDAGQVPLHAVEQHLWIYESDYYQSLIEKARLTNPTELVSRGHDITLQHTCLNRTLAWCKHMEAYFIPNVEARTNGQVRIEITSLPELGLAGFETMDLLEDGTLGMTEVYGGFVGDEFPTLVVQYLWGLWPDHQTHYEVLNSIFDDIENVIQEETGALVIFHNWIVGDDQFIFSNHKLDNLEDFRGLSTRSHSVDLSNWINGMGADARSVAFAQVYTELEREELDAAVTGANPGFSQRWYEVTDYVNGRLYSINSTPSVIGGEGWNGIPADLQQILIEEGAKHELEALRLGAIQNLTGLQRNIDAGLEFVEFSPEIREASFHVARDRVLPNWLRRIGYPDRNSDAVQVFNDKVGPFVGLSVDSDGSVREAPITRGPHAGRTMAEVLSE